MINYKISLFSLVQHCSTIDKWCNLLIFDPSSQFIFKLAINLHHISGALPKITAFVLIFHCQDKTDQFIASTIFQATINSRISIDPMICCHHDPMSNALDVINAEPEPCHKHNKSIKFICKTCPHESLLCEQCIIDHQGHNWVTLSSYLTDDVRLLFETGQSKSGKAVELFVERILAQLVQYQQRIHKKIKETLGPIMVGLEKLKTKFPLKGGYQISGKRINQKNIAEIQKILRHQKYIFDTNRLQQTFESIIQASQVNINDNLQKMEETLSNKDWDLLQEIEIAKLESDFLSIYRKMPPNRKFCFSMTEKSPSIKIVNNRLTAMYMRDIPKSPVALLDKGFREDLHVVGFKITKMQTHAHFFDMSSVFIGMCNPELAESFGYLDFSKPSKGAYLISSKGRSYHSKLPEYHDTSLAFSFRGGDIVTIDLNIQNGDLIFEKKTGKLPFWKRLSMPLGLDPKYVVRLKPCIMFQGEEGAEVTILNETELQLEIDGKTVYPFVQI